MEEMSESQGKLKTKGKGRNREKRARGETKYNFRHSPSLEIMDHAEREEFRLVCSPSIRQIL